MAERHVAAEHACGDHAGEVDRVLRAPEGRRVAELDLLEVVDGRAQLDRHGERADPLVDAVLAGRLGTEQLPSDLRNRTFIAIGFAPG